MTSDFSPKLCGRLLARNDERVGLAKVCKNREGLK